jgi:hypothetical protein
MAGIVLRFAEPAPRAGGHRPSLRAAPRAHELTDVTARLPPEIAFLAGEGLSPERLLNAIASEPRSVRPLDKLLSEGHISEDAYYRALARHLGCRYYDGDPPLADAFDAVRGLNCGVAPLEPRGQGPRAVIAPRSQFVPRLIEMAQSSRYRSGSFALASPQRFAGLLRARRRGIARCRPRPPACERDVAISLGEDRAWDSSAPSDPPSRPDAIVGVEGRARKIACPALHPSGVMLDFSSRLRHKAGWPPLSQWARA